ncbi:MAG: type II toxin-antitoxin system VapC family toxin [Planctomycetes bacterium]|nr:type II toxin-antitoxin system VapC family toxin [Planctomycetota bacterium]
METVKRVGIDTNIFIGIFLEEKEKIEPSLAILKLISDGVLEGVVSVISLIEIAILFFQKNEMQKGRKAIEFIKALPNITIVDITSDMVLSIANTKISEKLSIADAVVLSATVKLSSDVFLTYDDDFAKVKKIQCMKPEDYLEKELRKN